jgi:hypothetical protein
MPDSPVTLPPRPSLEHINRHLQVEGCRNVTRAAMASFRPGVRVTYSTV